MTRVMKCLTLLAAVGLMATNVTAQQDQQRPQRGPQAQDGQQRGSQNQKLMSKDELTKKYDTNNDGTLDYREKMAFIKSLDENQKAAYRSSFTQAQRDLPGQRGSQAQDGQQRRPQAQQDQQRPQRDQARDQQRAPQAQHGQQRGPQAQQRGPQGQQRGPQAQAGPPWMQGRSQGGPPSCVKELMLGGSSQGGPPWMQGRPTGGPQGRPQR